LPRPLPPQGEVPRPQRADVRPQPPMARLPAQPARQASPALQTRPPASHTPPVPRPLPSKTPDDLKAILRAMVAKTGSEREHKQSVHQQSLKGVLSGVLEKNKPIEPNPVEEEKKPFEVPESELRKVLKGEG